MAGWVHHGRLTDLSDEDWQRSFQINVDSMFYVLRGCLSPLELCQYILAKGVRKHGSKALF